MKDEISINVEIADVKFPLTIGRTDEENVRKAAKMINDRVRQYRENFGISDKSNILSMVLLEIGCELQGFRDKKWIEDNGITEEIKQLNNALDKKVNNL